MKKRKMVAPIIITALIIITYILYFLIIALVDLPIPVLIIFGVIVVAISGVAVFVLVERIKEIRSGEEDDLSKY